MWADTHTDRTVELFGLSAEIPTTWFQAFNPFMIFAFTPFVIALWTRQAASGSEPSTITKMSLGCFGVALSYCIMAAAAWHAGGGKASWSWLFAYFVVITIGELYLSPVGLSLITKIAPVRILSMMMGVWLATSFVGGFLAGWLGSFWSRMEKPEFFLLIAAVAAVAGAAIFACRWLSARNAERISRPAPKPDRLHRIGNGTYGMSELREWLRRNKFEQYADAFEANDIGLDILPELNERDLEQLGVSLGNRRRLLKAIAEGAADRAAKGG